MGGVRANKSVAKAGRAGALAAGWAGALTAGCAALPAAEAGGSRLEWLAAELAKEVQAASPADARARAAQADLHAIAAFAETVEDETAFVLRLDWPLPLREEPPAALDAVAAVDLVAAPRLPPAQISAPGPATAASPIRQAQAGLALGRFTDARMAEAMWREIESLEAAGLTGLQAFVATSDGGLMLLAGPLTDEAAAAERCLALTPWGLSCVPTMWPTGAQPLPRSGA